MKTPLFLDASFSNTSYDSVGSNTEIFFTFDDFQDNQVKIISLVQPYSSRW